LIELMIVVAIVGILAVLAIYGVRKYITNAKTAEARNGIGQMGKDQSAEWEMEAMPPTVLPVGSQAATSHLLCASPSGPVPAAVPKGAKYQSNSATGTDWQVDSDKDHQGFACLKFSMDAPQYYQYNFATAAGQVTTWQAQAQGDLNGDGANYSLFTLDGAVNTTMAFNLAPNIKENNPEE
jgi:type IV pilus assembly protein PilA